MKRSLIGLVLTACTASPPQTTDVATSSTTTAPTPSSTIATTTAATLPTPTTTAPTTTTTVVPVFEVVVEEVTAASLDTTWRDGCPVGPSDLRMLTLSHHGYDGHVHNGQLVIHVDWVNDLSEVFRSLFEAGFPIERIEPMSVYEADDDDAMAANNSSGFNCRYVRGTNRWSEHSYGRAIDLSPLTNPWVRASEVVPANGVTDRDASTPGLIVGGDVVVNSFADIGWEWGGYWSSSKDYMHFSSTGR